MKTKSCLACYFTPCRCNSGRIKYLLFITIMVIFVSCASTPKNSRCTKIEDGPEICQLGGNVGWVSSGSFFDMRMFTPPQQTQPGTQASPQLKPVPNKPPLVKKK